MADDHAGLQAALREVRGGGPSALLLHFLRNALDHVPRKVDDDCLRELRWLYDWRVSRRRAGIWQPGSPWSAILKAHRLSRQHRPDVDLTGCRGIKHLKSTNMLERLNEEIRRRTCRAHLPNGESCGWCGHPAVGAHENWLDKIATSTWTICASTESTATRLTPDPFSLPCRLSRTLRAGSVRRVRGGILDCRCARRSAEGQVGTKGWLSDRTRDALVT